MGWLPEPVGELKSITDRNRRRQLADIAARGIDQQTAERIGQLGRWFPWMPAGVSVALARSGFNPLSPEVQQIARDVAVSTARDTPMGFNQPGDRVRADNVSQERQDNAVGRIRQRAREMRVAQAQRELNAIRSQGGVFRGALDGVTAEEWASRPRDGGGGLFGAAKSLHDTTSMGGLLRRGLGSGPVRDNPVTDRVLEPLARHTITGENPVARGARGVVRAGTAALQAPQQLAQAQYRTSMENIRDHGFLRGALWESNPLNPEQLTALAEQTDVGQAGVAARMGGADTGSGWFVNPDSGVGQARRRAEIARGGALSNGQVRTVGRDFADVFFEPGSREFNLMSGVGDAAVALGADALVTNPAQAMRAAGAFRTIDGVTTATTTTGRISENVLGLIRGVRPAYSAEKVDAFLSSGTGRRTIERIADTTSISKLDAAFDRKLDPALLRRLVDETDPTEISRILKSELGLSTADAPKTGPLANLGFNIKDAVPPRARRLFSGMPTRTHIDLQDTRATLNEVERALVNTNADRATIDGFMGRMAGAESNLARRQVWFDMMGDIAERAASDYGIDKARAREITRLFDNNHRDVRKYFVDAVGDDVNVLGTMVDGQLQRTPTPHLSVELLDRWMPVADPRTLRREFSDPVTKALIQNSNGDLRAPLSTMIALQERLWKPTALIRGAYTVRVMGEEQLRIAAAGFKAMPNHPMSYLSFLVGDSPRVERILNKWGVHGRGSEDIFAGLLDESDQFGKSMFSGGAVFDNEVKLSNYITFQRGETGYVDAAADELATLAADPVAQMVSRVAGGYTHTPSTADTAVGAANLPVAPGQVIAKNPLQEAQDRFWNEFKFLREQMADSNPEAWLDLTTRPGADEYIRTVLRRINLKAGARDDGTLANPELLHVIQTGRIRTPNGNVQLFQPGSPFINKDAVKALDAFTDVFPDVVRGPQTIRLRTGGRANFESLSRGVDQAFGYLATKPANYLSRSPVFRQSYVDEVIGLAPRLDPSYKDDLLRWADNNNLTKADKSRLAAVIGTSTGGDPRSMALIDDLAKGRALENVKGLLYDLADRNQFFDVFRLAFPFGEAWKEMVTTWGKLLQQNPKLPLTAKRVLEAGRNPAVGELVGAPEGQGAFYTNSYGEEVFTYPLSAQAMGLLGMPETPLTGRLAGLSLMTEVLPGVGPVMQLPLAVLIPDTPAFDGISNFLFPFGRPDSPRDVGASFALELMPPWFRTAVSTGFARGGITAEGQRQYANTTMDVMRHLVASGEYQITGNPDSSAELTRLITDAKDKAMWMTMIRGAAQFGAPSSPAFEWYVDSPDGRKLPMLTLVEDYRAMQEEDFASATERFLQKYGDNAFLLMQNKSQSISAGILAPTEQANEWLRENMWAQQAFPVTYGFFAPQGGEFNGDAYQRQLELQERKPLTPEQFVRAGNDLIGKSIYYAEREAMMEQATAQGRKSLDADQQAYMRDLDEWLRTNYEGYGDEAGKLGRANSDEMIDELTRAANDDRLRDTPMAGSVREYLAERDWVRQESKANLDSVNSYRSAVAGREYREYLEQYAESIIADNPDFAVVWERVFRAELDEGLAKDTQGEEN